MDKNPSKPVPKSLPPAASMARGAAPKLRQDDGLLGSSIFGPTEAPAEPVEPASAAKPAPALKLVVHGLKPIERQLLEGLVKVSQRRTPRLEILETRQATDADVI